MPASLGYEISDNRRDLVIPPQGGTTTKPPERIAVMNKGEPSPSTPSRADPNDTGHGGGVLSPGGVSLNASGVMQISKPGPMVAVSLGNSSAFVNGRLGFIIPAATGTGGVYAFNERQSYSVRAEDFSVTTVTIGTGTDIGSETRFRTTNGLSVLVQTSTNVLDFKFYAPGTFYTISPFNLMGPFPFRTMSVEKLTTGNPDNNKYSFGAKVTIARPYRADEWKIMWWNDSATVLNAYTALSTGVTIVTSSTTNQPVRTIDTTVTETFTDASGSSKTLTHRSRDAIRSLSEGAEQVEVHTIYLTDTIGAPSLTTTYDYYPDTADPINRRALHRKTEADGSWSAYARFDWYNGWTDSAVLRGWKDQEAPALTAIDTWTEFTVKVQSAGFAGTITRLDKRLRMSSDEGWANGYKVTSRSDWTTGLSQIPAYPYCSLITESVGSPGTGQAEEFFDTLTYQYGWDPTSDATAANGQADDVTTTELRHRTLDVYRFKRRTTGTNPHAPRVAIEDSEVISHTHYRYQSADSSTSSPGYTGTNGSYSNTRAYEVVDRVEDVTHLPSLMHRTVIDLVTGLTIAAERYMVTHVDSATKEADVLYVLEQRWTFYDSMGRPASLRVNGVVMETWDYPAEDTVEHQDSTGATIVTKYASSGRVIYTMRENVASTSFAGITTYSGAAQPSIFTEFTYTPLTGGVPSTRCTNWGPRHARVPAQPSPLQ